MTIAQIPTAYAVDDDETLESQITQVSDNVKNCYSLSHTVKWLACTDLIFSMLFAFGNLYFFIPLVFAYTGYIGSKTFNKRYTLTYFFYIFFIACIRIGCIFRSIYEVICRREK